VRSYDLMWWEMSGSTCPADRHAPFATHLFGSCACGSDLAKYFKNNMKVVVRYIDD